MTDNYQKHYGLSSISDSLSHFLVGKGFKIITSVSVLVLLARYMVETEYAVYISFQAVIIIIGLLATVGFQAVLNRYLPELRANGNNISMYRLMLIGLSLSVAALLGVIILAIPLAGTISGLLNFQDWVWLLPWYLLVGIVRLSTLSISQCMESLLWQKDAQYSLATGSLIRFLLVIGYITLAEIDLVAVVIIEAIAESMTFALITYRYYRKWKSDAHRSEGSQTWWGENKKRVIRYGFVNYLVGQSTLLYGSAPNRILLAAYLPPVSLAGFGFADGFANLSRRFMPSRLLIGFIRPIFMARYSTTSNFQQLNRMSNYVFRVNLILLVLPISLLFVVGEPLFDWLTAGKYGDAAFYLAGFFILIVFESMYSLLGLVVQAIEKNEILVAGNIIKSLSLFAAIPLIYDFGVWSLILANIFGVIAANLLVLVYLYRHKYHYKMDYFLIFLNIAYGVFSGLLGWLAYAEFGSIVATTLIIIVVYSIFCIVKPPIYENEKKKSIDLLLKSIREKSNAD